MCGKNAVCISYTLKNALKLGLVFSRYLDLNLVSRIFSTLTKQMFSRGKRLTNKEKIFTEV